MGYFDWDYNKLPESELETVKQALNDFNLVVLFNIYNKHKLGNIAHCCPNPIMFEFFTDLIDKRTA